jgi:hypothetical protein
MELIVKRLGFRAQLYRNPVAVQRFTIQPLPFLNALMEVHLLHPTIITQHQATTPWPLTKAGAIILGTVPPPNRACKANKEAPTRLLGKPTITHALHKLHPQAVRFIATRTQVL